jgi:hypothetical protein
MNIFQLTNYATLSRKFRHQPAAMNFSRQRKSQTVSGQSRKIPFAAWLVLSKVGTVSAQFEAPPAAILSTASIESPQSKIQTASGQFGRRCLRNLEFIAGRVAVALAEFFDTLRPAHPPSLWPCQAQMWRVFLSLFPARGIWL